MTEKTTRKPKLAFTTNARDCQKLEKVVSHFFCPVFFLASHFKIYRAIAIC